MAFSSTLLLVSCCIALACLGPGPANLSPDSDSGLSSFGPTTFATISSRDILSSSGNSGPISVPSENGILVIPPSASLSLPHLITLGVQPLKASGACSLTLVAGLWTLETGGFGVFAFKMSLILTSNSFFLTFSRVF